MAAARAAIEKKHGPGAIYDPGFDEIMMKQIERAGSPDIVQDIALAYDIMISAAPNIDRADPNGLRPTVGEIAAKTSLDKRFIRFHEEFKKMNIGGIDIEAYILKFEKDKASGMVPVNKQSHLRPLATINQVNKCISILKSKPKIKRSMWSRRAQEYEAKISSGKIYDLAEVVRDLNKGDDLMVDQSYSERQLFEKAYERILSEFQIILNLSLEDTQRKLDKALKRNIGAQVKAAPTAKAETTELPVDEPISDTDEPIEE